MIVNRHKGSTYLLPVHGSDGARARKNKFAVNSSEGTAEGEGEGIFARLLIAPKARLGSERLRSLASQEKPRRRAGSLRGRQSKTVFNSF